MPKPVSAQPIIPLGQIEQRILLIRGQRVILDADLAALYGVTTKRLNEQVKRNLDRFPDDFLIQLTWEEAQNLRSHSATSSSDFAPSSRSQIATLKRGKNVKYRPFAFTEHGAIMAANLLRSEQAVKISVYVVRAFVKLRELLSTHRELALKLDQLERKLQAHDSQILGLLQAIRQLMQPPPDPPKPPIGFLTEGKSRKKR
jgi:hypothetical protein